MSSWLGVAHPRMQASPQEAGSSPPYFGAAPLDFSPSELVFQSFLRRWLCPGIFQVKHEANIDNRDAALNAARVRSLPFAPIVP